jgi:hypothetical protein
MNGKPLDDGGPEWLNDFAQIWSIPSAGPSPMIDAEIDKPHAQDSPERNYVQERANLIVKDMDDDSHFDRDPDERGISHER